MGKSEIMIKKKKKKLVDVRIQINERGRVFILAPRDFILSITACNVPSQYPPSKKFEHKLFMNPASDWPHYVMC